MIAVFVVLLTVDLVLKSCEEVYNWNFKVIPGLIYVESGSRNTGAAFSFLSDVEWGRILFIVLTFIMLIVMIAAFLLLPERLVGLKVALVMVAAGALGNLVDRLAFKAVRDFVWVNIFGKWACCNFADFWIVFGVIYAVIDMLFINELALFLITKTAKEAAKARELAVKQEQEEQAETTETTETTETAETPAEERDIQPEPEEKTDGGNGEE